MLDNFSNVSHATPVLLSDQSVFESESYAVSPSGVDSSPTSGSPVPPANTSITVPPANRSIGPIYWTYGDTGFYIG